MKIMTTSTSPVWITAFIWAALPCIVSGQENVTNSSAPSLAPSMMNSSAPSLAPSTMIVPTLAPTLPPAVEVFIHDVQGSSDTSPLEGVRVNVTAVVTADFQSTDENEAYDLSGFVIQEEDEDADDDPMTSEGIFVFDGSLGVDVVMGDLVQVTGFVSERFGQTQISADSVTVLESDQTLPELVSITLLDAPNRTVTLNDNDQYQPDLEAYEGMRVSFPETLQIIEMFQLDRFNEIKLVAGPRPFSFTQTNMPNGPEAWDEHLQALGARRITYDDGRNDQNVPIGDLDGFGPVYNTATANRMGDTVTGLQGVLTYDWAGSGSSGSTWRVRSPMAGINTFVTANPRPTTPPPVWPPESDMETRVLTFGTLNVLNFFTTIDDDSGLTSGPNGLDPRGADSTEEYERQLNKTVVAILELDADIIGLVEIENEFNDQNGDGKFAIGTLVDALNAGLGETVYAWVDPGVPFVGGDAIACGFIYKFSAAEVIGDTAILDSSVDPLFIDTKNRPVVMQSFQPIGYPAEHCLTLSVTHLKSKGSSCDDVGDPGLNDGTGNCNVVRLNATTAMIDWIESDPTGQMCPYQGIMGDLNSYAMEEPIRNLNDAGFANKKTPFDYSYVFDGQMGTLDYVLANAALDAQTYEGRTWHINEDEADALDYNLDFGRDPAIFDGTSPARNSDHSPVMVGFYLSLDTMATPTGMPTSEPAVTETEAPTSAPTDMPTLEPTVADTDAPSESSSVKPRPSWNVAWTAVVVYLSMGLF
eukprot:scaffold11998_cov174-Amphora_coffeaeformis.AAC.5